MAYWSEFLLIAMAHFFAVASPGPDFAVVLKQGVQHGRKHALYTSAGVGAGISVHVAYCLVGVAVLFTQFPWLFNGFKYAAALYLAYMGIQALRFAKPATKKSNAQHAAPAQPQTYWQAFKMGFLVNALNPKATLFFLSLFTLVINPHTPKVIQLGYGVYLALATWAWFSFLSVLLTRQRLRDYLITHGYWFDRAIGVVLLLLAAQVIWL